MSTKPLLFIFLLLVFMGNAQSKDTIATIKNPNKISYKQFIVPVTLITAGTLLLDTAINTDLQSNANRFFGQDFHTTTDNFLPFAPIAQIYLGKSLGFKPKNDFQHQTITILIANVIAVSTTEIIKRSTKRERPDLSDDLSFPSGHTSVAFTNASLLYYEYKDSNLWYASSGFLFATVTGILRIANNKHYTSDILAGAGIGLASGLIVSYWKPFKSSAFGKNKKTTALIYPLVKNQIGLGTFIQLN